MVGLVPWRHSGICRALGFAVTFLLSVLSLVEFGRFFGPYPVRFFGAYAIDMVFVTAGLALYWPLRRWRERPPTSDMEARSASRLAGGQ